MTHAVLMSSPVKVVQKVYWCSTVYLLARSVYIQSSLVVVYLDSMTKQQLVQTERARQQTVEARHNTQEPVNTSWSAQPARIVSTVCMFHAVSLTLPCCAVLCRYYVLRHSLHPLKDVGLLCFRGECVGCCWHGKAAFMGCNP
jgi:hypothetical protein